MVLIADSGSSTTVCRVLDDNGTITQVSCAGVNPYYHSKDIIYRELSNVLKPQIIGDVTQVYFYGAGCSTRSTIDKVTAAISSVFPKAEIEINHDLLAASRALCGSEKGIVCILGTGSNSCLYDGENIIDNIASLGYVMGDEGSGFDIGKRLIADYLRRDMPLHISDMLKDKYNISKADVLNNVYLKEKGSSYLAAFSKFVFEHIKEPYD